MADDQDSIRRSGRLTGRLRGRHAERAPKDDYLTWQLLRLQASGSALELISVISAVGAFTLLVLQFFVDNSAYQRIISLIVTLPVFPGYILVINALKALKAVRDMMNVNGKEDFSREKLYQYYMDSTRRRYLGYAVSFFFPICGIVLVAMNLFKHSSLF